MARVSGLDPAGPCFEHNLWDIKVHGHTMGISPGSALFVDNLHTDSAGLGTDRTKGHTDFMAGNPGTHTGTGGREQPACPEGDSPCCHTMAINYYYHSVTRKERKYFFTAYKAIKSRSSIGDRPASRPSPRRAQYAGYGARAVTRGSVRLFLPVFPSSHYTGARHRGWAANCDTSYHAGY